MQPLWKSNLCQETPKQTKFGVCVEINEITGKWCHKLKKKRICGYAQNTICNHSKEFQVYHNNYYMLQTILVYLWEKLEWEELTKLTPSVCNNRARALLEYFVIGGNTLKSWPTTRWIWQTNHDGFRKL